MLTRPPQKVHHADWVSSPAPARLSTPLHGSHSGWQQQASGRTSTMSQWPVDERSDIPASVSAVRGLLGCEEHLRWAPTNHRGMITSPCSPCPLSSKQRAETRSPSDRQAEIVCVWTSPHMQVLNPVPSGRYGIGGITPQAEIGCVYLNCELSPAS
jgi:hypothetical protein